MIGRIAQIELKGSWQINEHCWGMREIRWMEGSSGRGEEQQKGQAGCGSDADSDALPVGCTLPHAHTRASVSAHRRCTCLLLGMLSRMRRR